MVRAGLALAFVLFLGGLTYTAWLYSVNRPLNLEEEVYLLVPLGQSLDGLAVELDERAILSSPRIVFRLYARSTQDEGLLKAGEYRLTPGISIAGLLAKMRRGDVVQRDITFVEGLTFDAWRDVLASQPLLTHTIAGLTDAEVMQALGEAGEHPEGLFFPDTYHFVRGETDVSILRRARGRMAAALDAAWSGMAVVDTLNSPYELLVLASIVEKETGYEGDRPLVASVFLNRLERGMRLQSDPTVIYGLSDFDGDLVRKHLRTPTPFNTYTEHGLPPTPICNPGQASIDAVVSAPTTPYLYFVAQGDGRSYFSVSLEEHNDAVNRYQLSRTAE